MDTVHRQFLVLALFAIIGQYCLTKAQYPYPSPYPYPYPYPYQAPHPTHPPTPTPHSPTHLPTHPPIHSDTHLPTHSHSPSHANKTAQAHDSSNSTKPTNNTEPHHNQSAHAAPPEALECQHFLVSVALKKRPPGPEEGGPFHEMKCHICDNIKMIYRCYPCFTSVEVHNVTQVSNVTNSATNQSVVNLLMTFTCKGKHLKVLEAILKPHSILHSKCFNPACHASALVSTCAPVVQQCTAPVCVGANHYQVTPYPTPCPTSYPVAVVNAPAGHVQQAVQPPLAVPPPVTQPLSDQDSHSGEQENAENENEGEKEETEPQPIQLVGQTYIFPETYGQPHPPAAQQHEKEKEQEERHTDNKGLPRPYMPNYEYPGAYPLSINPSPCSPQCVNVCAPSCHPACCRSDMAARYKAFIQRMRNAANARALKFRNPLRAW